MFNWLRAFDFEQEQILQFPGHVLPNLGALVTLGELGVHGSLQDEAIQQIVLTVATGWSEFSYGALMP